MSEFHQTVENYLTVRRSLGYKLELQGRLLLGFASFLERAKSPFITTPLALEWAMLPASASPHTQARRIAIVRSLAKVARTLDPRTEVPPPKCIPYRRTRPLPYVYSNADLLSLLEGTQALHSSAFRRSTAFTFFGLLAITGMRVGEAIGLDCKDFDRGEGVLTIRNGKFGKSREIPLDTTVQAALRTYEQERDRHLPHADNPAFFLSGKGTRLLRQDVGSTFRRVLRLAGLSGARPRRPRIHDLRHSFAIHTLCDWYRTGRNVAALLPLLSTYLGHVKPSSTYWYLTAVPELVGLAAQRLERAMGELP